VFVYCVCVCLCVCLCVCISAENVQQSTIFYSVPSNGLVLFLNDKSVLVFRNVTLCDGFVRIRILMWWQSNARCVGMFFFQWLSFPCAECSLVNKHSAARNSHCFYAIRKSFTQQAEFRLSTLYWTHNPIQIPNNPLPVICVTVTLVAKVAEGDRVISSLYIFSHISFPRRSFFLPFFVIPMLYKNSEFGWAISSFRCDVDEICALLGYYEALSGNYLPTFRDNLSVPTSRIGYPGTSVRNYHSTLRSIPDECRSRWTISCVCNTAPFRSQNCHLNAHVKIKYSVGNVTRPFFFWRFAHRSSQYNLSN